MIRLKSILRAASMSLIAAAAASSISWAADSSPVAPSQEQMAAAMKAWQDASTPGEGHKVLDQFVGKWDTRSKMWFDGPSGVPVESDGTSESMWILDGRFL